MAEIVGLIASLATLCEVTRDVCRLGQDLRDAPAEIGRALREATQLATQSSLICELANRISSHSSDCGASVTLNLCRSLGLLKEDVDNINVLLSKVILRNAYGSRIQWVMLGKRDVTRLLEHLHHCRLSLVTTLSLALW